MKIETIRLRNFRSILDSGELRLRPLTLVVGPNDAGKSSLLQALAMLKQSLEQGEGGPPLAENGRLVEMGSYRQLVYLRETSRGMGFELGLAGDGATVRAGIEFAYSVRRKSVYLRGFEMDEGGAEPLLSVTADAAGKIEHAATAEPLGALAEPRILGTIRRDRCMFQVAPAWDRWGVAAGRPISEFQGSPEFYHRCARGLAGLETALQQLAYLGPDRATFRTVSHITGERLSDAGARGENAAALLHAHRYADEAAPAMRSAATWLERLGLGRHLRVVPIEEHLYEITIEECDTGLVMELSAAGRTVQQLFPLLVQGYLAAPGATLLLEEPEAHLHPRLHSELAEFLIETAGRGRRLLVETYSEPLVRRLRERIAGGALPAEHVGLLFAQKVEGITQFTDVPVEPDGTLRDWPADFWSA